MTQLDLPRLDLLRERQSLRGAWRVVRHETLNLTSGFLRGLDIAAVPVAAWLAYYGRFESVVPEPQHLLLVLLGMVTVAYAMILVRAYASEDVANFPRQIVKLVAGWGISIAVLLAIAFFDKIADQYSRLWIGYWFVFGVSLSAAGRYAVARYIAAQQRAGNLAIHVAIVGGEPFTRQVMANLAWPGEAAVKIVGSFVPPAVDELLRLARKSRVDEIIVQLPDKRDAGFQAMLRKLSELPVNVNLCPDFSDLPIAPRKFAVLRQTFMINVFERPLSGWSAVLKRSEDIVLSGVLLVLFLPLMLLIALVIKLDSPGPVFFLQPRFGFNNNPFTVRKFRTMAANAGNDASVPQARRNDPRVTRVGRFLRKASLDELPQLINVLTGEMSLVGPRPHAIAHNEYYADLIDGYLHRHRVKPGITGWAQVNGLRGETATLQAMHERVKHDLYYIEHWSLLLDIWILMRTLTAGFVHRNAY